MARWCNAITKTMENVEPRMPSGVDDRDADCWEPLLALADAAGGDWPNRARAAAVALVAGAVERTQTKGVELLSDLYDIFKDADALPTQTILERLHNLPESQWKDVRGKPLDDRGLATRLKRYQVKPKVVRIGTSTPRGYRATDLQDAWKRYVIPFRPEAQQAQQAQQSATIASQNTAENSQKNSRAEDVADVADVADRWEERAAVLEHDGGLSRDAAERMAAEELEEPELPDFLRWENRGTRA